MNEDILVIVHLNEAITFGIIEPLDFSLFQTARFHLTNETSVTRHIASRLATEGIVTLHEQFVNHIRKIISLVTG